jgi:hypothetical protein
MEGLESLSGAERKRIVELYAATVQEVLKKVPDAHHSWVPNKSQAEVRAKPGTLGKMTFAIPADDRQRPFCSVYVRQLPGSYLEFDIRHFMLGGRPGGKPVRGHTWVEAGRSPNGVTNPRALGGFVDAIRPESVAKVVQRQIEARRDDIQKSRDRAGEDRAREAKEESLYRKFEEARARSPGSVLKGMSFGNGTTVITVTTQEADLLEKIFAAAGGS